MEAGMKTIALPNASRTSRGIVKRHSTFEPPSLLSWLNASFDCASCRGQPPCTCRGAARSTPWRKLFLSSGLCQRVPWWVVLRGRGTMPRATPQNTLPALDLLRRYRGPNSHGRFTSLLCSLFKVVFRMVQKASRMNDQKSAQVNTFLRFFQHIFCSVFLVELI